MSFELPDIIQPRNIIAALVAVALEFGISALNGVQAFTTQGSWGSFALFLIICLVLAWIIERVIKWAFGGREEARIDAQANARSAEGRATGQDGGRDTGENG